MNTDSDHDQQEQEQRHHDRKQLIVNLRQEALDDRCFRVLICVTGSVAAIKLEELVLTLHKQFQLNHHGHNDDANNDNDDSDSNNNNDNNNTVLNNDRNNDGGADKDSNRASNNKQRLSIIVALTQGAQHFVGNVSRIESARCGGASGRVTCFTDQDEWSMWSQKGDPVTHIELRKWADLLLIAPLDANTLAKIANGICDNLVTCVCRAWDIGAKPWLVAPAMNTLMWSHPFTRQQLSVLEQQLRVTVIDPISKVLVCGDQGVGAMANVNDIVAAVLSFDKGSRSLTE